MASARSSQKGIEWKMPFDFVAQVRCFFGLARASSNAYRMIRSMPRREKTLSCTTISASEPSKVRPPSVEYSPSLFSLTTTKSMSPASRPRRGD